MTGSYQCCCIIFVFAWTMLLHITSANAESIFREILPMTGTFYGHLACTRTDSFNGFVSEKGVIAPGCPYTLRNSKSKKKFKKSETLGLRPVSFALSIYLSIWDIHKRVIKLLFEWQPS